VHIYELLWRKGCILHIPLQSSSRHKSILKLLNNTFLHFLQFLRHDTLPPYSNSFALY
jgi:hypothetical protein